MTIVEELLSDYMNSIHPTDTPKIKLFKFYMVVFSDKSFNHMVNHSYLKGDENSLTFTHKTDYDCNQSLIAIQQQVDERNVRLRIGIVEDRD
jgi:hypothetical protein